jgi:hypothetical protein
MVFERVLSRVGVTDLQLQLALAGAALLSFGGLLIQDRVHPVLVYVLQLYLTF